MKKRATRSRAELSARMRPNHALVGVWEQQPNPGGTTSVVYTVLVERGRLLVRGNDEEDGVLLEISRIRWDGQSLSFTTVFPPTKHKAKHVLTALSKRKMTHRISCTYADGEVFSDDEIWRKRLRKKK